MVEDYTIPITTCVVSLNLEVPVGIKITTFDINQLSEVGVFIKLDPDTWGRPASDRNKMLESVRKPADRIAEKVSK
jgi:hypothetical protein